MIWLFIACFLPTPIESYLDRKGEDKTGKRKDSIWLLVTALALAAIGRYTPLHVDPLATFGLILGFRVLIFDYLTNWFLKQRENHKNINIWTYLGDSTHWWDQLVSKVHPAIRLVVRLLIFLGALFYFFYTP